MPREYPTISLCMISRDEERFIGGAIESVLPIVSEIILVDTGSSDRTIEIAQDLGATILERPWDDDFSAPRNLSLEKATGDWILVLDADERIDESDHQRIRELTTQPDVCYEITQRHYSNDVRLSGYLPCQGKYPQWEKGHSGYFESNCCRLFPNHAGINFQGRVHELVEHSIKQLCKHKLINAQLLLHHYGHIDEVKRAKNKTRLYTPLGQLKTEEHPQAWKNFFELGVEYNCSGRKKESIIEFQRAAALEPRYIPTWINLGYVLCEEARYQEAIDALNQALALDHKNPEAHCNIAVVYMRLKNWIFAEAHLRKAIELKPDYINAISNLGHTFLQQKMLPEAIAMFQRTVELMPTNPNPRVELGVVLMLSGDNDNARKCFENCLALDPNCSKAYYYLGHVCKRIQETKLALEAFRKFCDLEETRCPAPPPQEVVAVLNAVKNECNLLSLELHQS